MSTRTTQQPAPRPPRRTALWVVLILFAALAANGVAYAVLRGSKSPQPAAPPGPAATAPAAEDENEGLARARRAAGIAALEHRDYDRAVTELTEALRLKKEKGDLAELLNIANEMRARDKVRPAAVAAAPPAAPPPEPAPSRAPSKPSKPTRVATRTPPPPEPAPTPAAAEPPRNGLLLVTSTPPGLVVAVDGKAMDLTPARVSVKPGSHRVTLAQGDRRVLEETVEVGEDAVRPINWEAKAEPPPAVAARTEPAPAPSPAAPAAKPPPAPVETAAAVPSPGPASAGGKGDLEVTSPSLYGEIWINDRPYGFPPVTARGLPAGKARVEVRVQGAVKRKMTVDVAAGTSTPVRVR